MSDAQERPAIELIEDGFGEDVINELRWTLRGLRARIAELEAENERLRHFFFRAGGMEDAPCLICGYNGPNYYHSGVHPCAEQHHKRRDHEQS